VIDDLAIKISALLLILAVCMPAYANRDETMLLKVRVGGFGLGLEEYEIRLVELLAEKTRDIYGRYKVEGVEAQVSLDRLLAEIETGKRIHLGFNTQSLPAESTGKIVSHSYPILGGALGLRKSIVRKNYLDEFLMLREVNDFQNMRVGQGSDWPDRAIYKSNGFAVFSSTSDNNMYNMLKGSRTHHVPLSAFQIDATFSGISKGFPELTIAQNIYIYYPLPIWAYLAKNPGDVTNRLSLGLERVFSDGSADALFMEMYGEYLVNIKKEKGRIFVLQNPQLNERENEVDIQRFLERFDLQEQAVYVPQIESLAY